MNYFENRKERSDHAKAWTKLMTDCYEDDVVTAINSSEIIDHTLNKLPDIKVIDSDSVKAIFDYYDSGESICVLNFASFKEPGGKFYDGSSAQEESLCHSSTLYPVLRRFQKEYYDVNKGMLNNALYRDRAIYSPEILFFEDNSLYKFDNDTSPRTMYADVITCACPNKTAAQKYRNIPDEVNSKVLRERIKFVLDIAEKYKERILILGAYGCGVFGQDPYEVAKVFKDELKNRDFSEVVFPIPGGANLKAFEDVFKDVI